MAGPHPRASSGFGRNADAYDRGRPGWPAAALDAIAARLDLAPRSAVLDLAAGTGKLTRRLAERFADVVAVEPLDGMRAVLERTTPGARVLVGRAEAIPLDDASVDAVFVAEAFHWFDAVRAAAEIARVLRPGGGVAVLYNRRPGGDDREPWAQEVHAVFEAHRLPPDDVDPFDERPWREALAARFGVLHDDAFENVVTFTREELLAQFASYSVIGGLPDERRDAALAAFAGVLDRHGVREARVAYRTEVVVAHRLRR